MELCELLDIEIRNCIFLGLNEDLSKRAKEWSISKFGTEKEYNFAKTYEYNMAGLLSQKQKDVIKGINDITTFVSYIDVIVWNYNSTALVFGEFFEEKILRNYYMEMNKLFYFFKIPFANLVKNNYNEDFYKKIKDKIEISNFIDIIRLFPRFAMMCEGYAKLNPQMQQIDAIKAQLNIWNIK